MCRIRWRIPHFENERVIDEGYGFATYGWISPAGAAAASGWIYWQSGPPLSRFDDDKSLSISFRQSFISTPSISRPPFNSGM